MVAERGLILLDVWSDEANQSVTLVVEQNGYSETQLVIAHDKTKWQVAIRASSDCDEMQLLGASEALQERFASLGLGEVALSSGRD